MLPTFLPTLYSFSLSKKKHTIQNQFYILQSRPITTNNQLSNWELLHEMDTAVMSPDDLFSFANVGEVMPGCMTPLTSSTIMNALQIATLRAVKQYPYRYRSRFEASYARTHHRLSMNVYQIFLPAREPQISLADQILCIAVSGNEYITPEMHRISVQRNGIQSGGDKITKLVDVLKCCWSNGSVVARLRSFMDMFRGRFSAENLRTNFANYDARQFAGEIDFELLDVDRLQDAFWIHTHASMVSTTSQLFAGITLAAGAAKLNAEHLRDIATMLGSCSDVESAEVPTMLEQIANTIYMAGKTEEFLLVQPDAGQAWLSANCAAAARMLRNFISRHGHRAFKEFELMARPWASRPECLIEIIQANSRNANATAIQKTKRAASTNAEIIGQLRTPKSWLRRRILGFLLTLCQRSVQRREITKSLCIAYVNEIRKAYRHLGGLLVNEGLLPAAELIFFVTYTELKGLMRGPVPAMAGGYAASKTTIVAKAQRRQRLFPVWEELRFAEMNKYLPKPTDDNNNNNNNTASDGDHVVHGTSVYEGCITGRACVIGSFAEVNQIRAGDILVTLGTDIAWSTYFPLLGGVVTELGGLISHGAVVAREYGLPCIVGAAGATKRLRHGERVTLDATNGLIYAVVEESEA